MGRFQYSACNKINFDVLLFLVLIFFGSLNSISDGCEVGYYGKSCSNICPNYCHDKECNVTSGKCLSCMKGYFSNNENDCISCPANCTACNSYNFCFACNTGYRGEVCEYMCTYCKPATSCDKNTGYCFENCSEGLSGELCNIQCDYKCKSCDRHNWDLCTSCADNENGKLCKEECFYKCLRSTCNESHGSCAEECLSGYTTETCNRTCSSHCKDRCKNRCKDLVPLKNSSSTSKANIGLIVGLIIGSIVIISVCISVVIIIRRRCYKPSDRTQVSKRTLATNDDENIEMLPREAKRTTETKELPSANKLAFLQMQGAFSAIEKKYGDVKINLAGNMVTVEGAKLDIENSFKEINIKCHNIEQVKYKHSKSREWLHFYQKESIIEYVKQKLKLKQLLGIWDITGTELTVVVHGKGNSENFKDIVLESVLEISEPVHRSSTHLLSSEWWGKFLLDIRSIFQEKVNIFTKEQQYVVIICTDDIVQQVKQLVKEFFDGSTDAIPCEPGVCEYVSKYWTQDEFDDIRKNGVMIKIKANGFRLRGLSNNVIKGKQMLNVKLSHMCSKEHVLKGTGMVTVLEAAAHSGTIGDIEKEYRCVMMLPLKIDESMSVMLKDVIDSQLLEEKHQKPSTNTSTVCFQTRRHKIKIQLIQGDIVHQKADIVVGTASNRDLQSGSAFNSSLEQGGPKLKTDYNRRYPNGIQNGEVAVIDSGNFKCDKIYLTSLPPWKEASRNGGKVLRNFMRECLRLADKFDKNSIALSSSVTGVYLGYPMDMAVSIIYGTVAEFDSSYSKTSLNEINIVEDDESIKTCIMCHLKTQVRETRTKRIFIEDGTILSNPYEDFKYRMVKDGCAIGPIQLQVQIGDLLNCTADAIVIGVGANIGTKENVPQKDVVVITKSTELGAKHVIHVLFQESLAGWRSKLVDCLEEASKKGVKSVALPFVGSGAGPKLISPDSLGACLFAAIDDFTSQNPVSSVTDVRLMVPESNAGCIPAFLAALQARTTDVNLLWGVGKIFSSQLGFVDDSNQFKEYSVTVYSDSTININRCIEALDDKIGLEFTTKVVDADMDYISSFIDVKVNSFIDSDILVDVKCDKQAGQFTIFGPLRNVLATVTCLHNKTRQYKMEKNSCSSAMELYDQIKWHWLFEKRVTLEMEMPYDMMTNFYIENAYREGKQTVELQSKDGKIYVINFHKLAECLKVNIYDTVVVIRRNIVKDIKIPLRTAFWNAMTSDSVEREMLNSGTKYQKVEKRFLDEVKKGINASKVDINVEVVKIELIKNRTLYQQYEAKKKQLKQEKSGCKQIKRKLWHETAEESIPKIINNGFNRSYCGVQEDSYGQGVYFAEGAFHHVKSNLSENKPGVKRYVFMAKVLTGELIKGSSSMRVLPSVDPAKPTITYDSAVDDVNNPKQFVIFHDKQAYPKYLITYTLKYTPRQ